MNTQKNQRVNFHFVVGMLALVGILTYLVREGFDAYRDQSRAVTAWRQAEVLAYQAIEISNGAAAESALASGGRAPASVGSRSPASVDSDSYGSLSVDPWGKAYRYKVLPAVDGVTTVRVWSAGPNGIFETDLADTKSVPKSGDDIGVTVSYNEQTAAKK
ncbi:MAG: hypothetical protein EOP06_22220 [Proteobacteria bacterium]|nr:MAG: hypothetical protein EOP06_22220 [Pseudomonadota bacterium]